MNYIRQLPPDVQYSLDCMHTLLELTPDLYCGMNFRSPFEWNFLTQFDNCSGYGSLDLANLVAANIDPWHQQKPNACQNAMAGHSVLFDSCNQINELIGDTTSTLVDAYKLNNNLMSLDDTLFAVTTLESAADHLPNLRTKDDLFHPSNIARALMRRNSARLWLSRMNGIAIDKTKQSLKMPISQINDFLHQEENRMRQREAHRQMLIDRHVGRYTYVSTTEELGYREKRTSSTNGVFNSCQLIEKGRRKHVRTLKKRVTRALNLFRSIFGNDDRLELFLSGGVIEVNGRLADYRITRSVSVIKHTLKMNGAHIPYQLEVICKDSGLVVSELCAVFKDTPVLDQIIGALMIIESGNEEDLLTKGNFFNVRDPNHSLIKAFTQKPQLPSLNTRLLTASGEPERENTIDELRNEVKANVSAFLRANAFETPALYDFLVAPEFTHSELLSGSVSIKDCKKLLVA